MGILEDVLLDRRDPTPQFTGPEPATVLGVSDTGRLMVALEVMPDLVVECAWSRPLAQTTSHSHSTSGGTSGSAQLSYDPGDPPAGTRCLVLFAGLGASDAWVVQFDRYPA